MHVSQIRPLRFAGSGWNNPGSSGDVATPQTFPARTFYAHMHPGSSLLAEGNGPFRNP